MFLQGRRRVAAEQPPQEQRRLVAFRGIAIGQHAVDVRPGLVMAGSQQRQDLLAHRLGGADAELHQQIDDRRAIEADLFQSSQDVKAVVGGRRGQGVADGLLVLQQIAGPAGERLRVVDAVVVADLQSAHLLLVQKGAGDPVGRQPGAFQHRLHFAQVPRGPVGPLAFVGAPGLVDLDDEGRQPFGPRRRRLDFLAGGVAGGGEDLAHAHPQAGRRLGTRPQHPGALLEDGLRFAVVGVRVRGPDADAAQVEGLGRFRHPAQRQQHLLVGPVDDVAQRPHRRRLVQLRQPAEVVGDRLDMVLRQPVRVLKFRGFEGRLGGHNESRSRADGRRFRDGEKCSVRRGRNTA